MAKSKTSRSKKPQTAVEPATDVAKEAVDAASVDVESEADSDTSDAVQDVEEKAAAVEDAAIVEDTAALETSVDLGAVAGTGESDAVEPETGASTESSEAVEDAATVPEPAAQSIDPPAPEVVREVVVEKQGSFLPMVIGGFIAAGLGFGASQYSASQSAARAPVVEPVPDLTEPLGAQAARIDELAARLDDVPVAAEPFDAASLTQAIADVQGQIEVAATQLGDLEARLAALEAAPTQSSDAAAPVVMPDPVDLSPLEAEIAALKAALDDQSGVVAGMIATAEAAKESAEETAKRAVARGAVTEILVALESGAGFTPAIETLTQSGAVEVPAVLAEVSEKGLPTLSDLTSSFPAVARDALAAARAGAEPEAGGGGLGSLFARQLGVRSVMPREGNDPDAILSRMEAAVKDGNISEALAEMEALPDSAKASLAEWAAQANLRGSALQEAQALATSLNSQ